MNAPAFLSLFGRLGAPFLVPAKTASVAARSRGRGRPDGRRAKRAFLDGGEHGGKLSTTGMSARTSRAQRASTVLLLPVVCVVFATTANAQGVTKTEGNPQIAAAIAEASDRFGVPERVLRALIAVESGGDRLAVSPKGAMGLAQLMPGTWTQMRRDLGLGADVFDRRDNVLAGAAYLRQLQDQYGPVGGFAAYNAGPGRYAAYLSGVKPLPLETQAYVAAIGRRLGWSETPAAPTIVPIPDWRAAPIFVGTVAPFEGGGR